uniref:trypsin n=1 Tax=Erpetoichthys calabaricus TaxID=27687 RepID=A0A8C4S503_ERPCA
SVQKPQTENEDQNCNRGKIDGLSGFGKCMDNDVHYNIKPDRLLVIFGDYFTLYFSPAFPKQLQSPAILGSYVSIVVLPHQDASIPEGYVCRVSGWGYTNFAEKQASIVLRTVNIPIISPVECNGSSSFNGYITSKMLCAGYNDGGKDACKGDSGGPLVCEGRVYGIVSWGKSCGEAHYPGVYTAVAQFRTWIDETMEGNTCETV